MSVNTVEVTAAKAETRCRVPWCRTMAYPGSDLCQFHEVVNPFADEEGHDPDLDENGVCRVCGKYEVE